MQHMISRTALLVLIFNVRLNADVVITDTWVSMGKEAESTDRLKALAPYRVDRKSVV